jgi:hypothetical protein
MAHRLTHRLARLESGYFDCIVEEVNGRLNRHLAAGTAGVVAAFNVFKQRQAEAEQASDGHLSAAKLLRWPGIDEAVEQLFDQLSGRGVSRSVREARGL